MARPTHASDPPASDFYTSPWTDDVTGQQWLSQLVAPEIYRWTPYTAPATGGGDLTSGPVTSTGGVSAIADGALSIAKTSGLSDALAGKQASGDYATNTALTSGLAGKAPLVSPSFTTPALGTPTSGNLANCTFPTFNQTTTGSAATLTTPRTINGVSFDGSANIGQDLQPTAAPTWANIGVLGTSSYEGSINFKWRDSSTYSGLLKASNFTAFRGLSLPDKDGTLAITSDITWSAIGGTGTAASPTFTTVTASGAVTCGSEGASNTLTVGNQTANSSTAKIRINGKSGGGTALHGEWVMRSNAYFALDTYGATDAVRVDASNGRVAFTRGIEGNTFHNGFLTIGTAALTTEDDGMLVVNKGYTTATGNHHAIRVKSTDSVLATGAGINFFDAQAIVSSNNNIDHIAEFQARSTKSGTGTMNDWFGYWTAPIFSAGTTTRAAHVHIEDATGAGALTTQYGIRIKSLTRATTNYGLVIEGNNSSAIGGTTPNANAILDLQSTTKPFMPPRMTTTERDAVASPTAGMMIYNSTTNKLNVYTTAWEVVTSL